MEKIILLFLTLILNVNLVYSQVTQEWVVQYNGTANMFDVPAKILLDNTGNVYIAGYSGELQTTSADYLLMKYSSAGNFIWKKHYDAANEFDGIYDAVIDSQNNIYVTGERRFTSINSDFYTIKYDSSGSVIWNMGYDAPPHKGDVPRKIFIDHQNNLYVTGNSAQFYSPVQTTGDILTIKYDSNGDSIWNSVYNNNGAYTTEDPADIYVDNSGFVYITGQGSGPFSSYDILTIKYDPDGNVIWTRRYNGMVSKDDYGVGIKVGENNNVYVLGSTTTALPENFDFVLIKYNQNGDTIWTKKYNGISNGRDFGITMTMSSDGYIYVCGVSDGNGIQNHDIVTIKYDSNGNVIWIQRFDGPTGMADSPSEIMQSPNGDIFIIGSSARAALNWDFVLIKYGNNGILKWFQTYNSQGNSDDNGVSIAFGENHQIFVTGSIEINGQAVDIATIKYSDIIGIQEISTEIPVTFSLTQNYPNPFNPATKISFGIPSNVKGEMSNVKLTIFDVPGREVTTLINEQLKPGTYEVDWDASAYPSGVYFYKLTSGDFSQARKMILIR